MKHYFYAHLSTVIEMSDDDFNILFEVAQHHYSYDVKSQTEHGGFLYGVRNRRDFELSDKCSEKPENVELDVVDRQLQLMIKALEMVGYTENKVRGIALYNMLWNIAVEKDKHQGEINSKLNTAT